MIVTIRSADDSREALYVAAAAVGIVALWSALVLREGAESVGQPLEQHQINGYQALNAVEQGLYADLEIAGQDIDAFHDAHEGAWPAIDALAAEFIPPFAADAAWARRGRPVWSLVNPEHPTVHVAAYAGISAEPGVAGSFVLFLEHRHEGAGAAPDSPAEKHFQIWYHGSAEAGIPAQLAEPGLIRNGWRQIVPYRGEQELQRLDRGTPTS